MFRLHVSATLRPTEAQLGQPCISTLLSFKDHTEPALDEVARDIIPAQLHPDPLASRGNVENSRGSAQWFPVEEAPRTMMSRVTVRTREPVRRSEVIRVETAMERSRMRGTVRMTTLVHRRLGHSPLLPCTNVLLPFMYPPHLMYDKVKPPVRASREMRSGTSFLPSSPPAPSRSTPPTAQAVNEPTVLATSVHDENGGETDPVPKCAKPQGGANMESELVMNGDDDDVASGGSGKREDDGVASPTGITETDGGCGMDSEPEKNSHDDEVPSGGSGNLLDKPIAFASGVAEVDGKYIAMENSSCHPNPNS
ncbi:Hypothetical predicted protein [Olea europaea subsp. europaea]|uniref:Uncharacterized protein n=1 Tax=Olea europaea subsp. europaea TaxID=158383 RepID=A0A8S0UGV9_OLEEU|nr:Hypothetical predicted protein [Olea europaea subsp. europaea]